MSSRDHFLSLMDRLGKLPHLTPTNVGLVFASDPKLLSRASDGVQEEWTFPDCKSDLLGKVQLRFMPQTGKGFLLVYAADHVQLSLDELQSVLGRGDLVAPSAHNREDDPTWIHAYPAPVGELRLFARLKRGVFEGFAVDEHPFIKWDEKERRGESR